jgi:hypothetical protein
MYQDPWILPASGSSPLVFPGLCHIDYSHWQFVPDLEISKPKLCLKSTGFYSSCFIRFAFVSTGISEVAKTKAKIKRVYKSFVWTGIQTHTQ